MSLLVGIVLFFILLGALGATLLGLPGNWFILLIIVLLGYFTGFTIISEEQTVIMSLVLLLGEAIESGLALVTANKHKPSKWSLLAAFIGGFIGALIGTSILPIIGSVIGAAIGVFALSYFVELRMTGNDQQAGKVAKAAMVGSLLGTTIKFILAISVVIYLLFSVFMNAMPTPGIGVPF